MIRASGVCGAAACALVAGASTLHAQATGWEVDVTGSRIEYDSVAPLNAPSISSLAEWQRPSLFGRLSGSLTGFQGSGWSLQGRGDLAGWVSPFGTAHPLRIEIGGAAGGSRHSSGFDAVVARGDARVHVRGRGLGVWAGTSLARARNSFDAASVSGVTPGVGAWAQSGNMRATLSYQHARVSGDVYREGSLAVSLTSGPIDLTVYGGLRPAPAGTSIPDERWAGATAAIWVHPRTAFIVTGGRYSSDVLQGLPGGQFVSIGLRVTRRRIRPIPFSAQAPIVYTSDAARTGSIGFRIEGATRVEIAGDWTAWERVPLARDSSGRWIVPAALAPGVYRFNLRVDDERWIVPEGFAQIDDGFGGRVGLLIIASP